MPQIRFYFDFISPFAYLGWRRLRSLTKTEIVPVPTLLAGLLSHHGLRNPAEIPAKRDYTLKHILRLASQFQVPIEPPLNHPFNSLGALRVASLPMQNAQRVAVVDRLFSAIWTQRLDPSDSRTLTNLFPGLDLGQVNTSANKATLKLQTDSAVERGVFGVPTMEVGQELFWGCDAIPHLLMHLNGKDPLDPETLSRWTEVQAVGAPETRSMSGENNEPELAGVLRELVDSVLAKLAADRVLMVYGGNGLSKGFATESIWTTGELSLTLLDELLQGGQPLVLFDVVKHPTYKNQTSVVLSSLRSIMFVPLRNDKGEMKGMLYMDNQKESGAFNDKQLDAMVAYTHNHLCPALWKADPGAGNLSSESLKKTRWVEF